MAYKFSTIEEESFRFSFFNFYFAVSAVGYRIQSQSINFALLRIAKIVKERLDELNLNS